MASGLATAPKGSRAKREKGKLHGEDGLAVVVSADAADRWSEVTAAYRLELVEKLKRLWGLHFDGVCDPPLTEKEIEVIDLVLEQPLDSPTFGAGSQVQDAIAIVQKRERWRESFGDARRGGIAVGRLTAGPERSDAPDRNRVSRKTSAGGAGDGVLRVDVAACQTLAENPMPDPAEVERIAASFRERGQDEPIIVLGRELCPIDLPGGKEWLVLGGATRLAAAVACGWDQIQARPRAEAMSRQACLELAFRNNADRRVIGTAERAAYAAAIAAAVADPAEREKAVASAMALDRSEINQLLRFSELPLVWQLRVARYERDRDAPDGIPWACAKAFLPYCDLPTVMAELEQAWERAYDRGALQTKSEVRAVVLEAVERATRPLEKSTLHDYGWKNGGRQPRLYELTPGLKEKLQVVKLPLGKNGKLVERITNVALNDELQQPFLDLILAKSRSNGGKAVKASAPKKLTPAQERAKHAEQDKQLHERIQRPGGLRELALRLALVEKLRPGDWWTEGLYEDLIATSRESNGSSHLDLAAWRYEAQRVLISRRKGRPPELRGYANNEKYAECSLAALDLDGDPLDDIHQVRVLTASFLLWPVQQGDCASDRLAAPDTLPSRWATIVPSVLPTWAARAGVTVDDTWEAAVSPGPARLWLEEFFAAHNRRQLGLLAADMRAAGLLVGCKTYGAEIKRLLDAHRPGQYLPLPGCLKAVRGKR